jgi:hypothetical protein
VFPLGTSLFYHLPRVFATFIFRFFQVFCGAPAGRGRRKNGVLKGKMVAGFKKDPSLFYHLPRVFATVFMQYFAGVFVGNGSQNLGNVKEKTWVFLNLGF